MNPELEERIAEGVNGMVLWGADEAAVLQKLATNGITGEAAQKIYQTARRSRISAIRADSWKQSAAGCLWWFAGMGS